MINIDGIQTDKDTSKEMPTRKNIDRNGEYFIDLREKSCKMYSFSNTISEMISFI